MHRSFATPRSRRRRLSTAVLAAAVLAGPIILAPSAAAAPNSATPYPVFAGSDDPVPALPAGHDTRAMMQSIFDADVAAGAGVTTGKDFWIDQMLARTGTQGDADPANSDNNQWLFSRGRTLFMKSHDPAQLGFAGDVAYIESINGRSAYTITVSAGGQQVQLREDTAARKQTPSYWQSTFTGSGLRVVQTKYMTDANVAVTALTLTNTGGTAQDVTLTAASPYATRADGDELVGRVDAFNKLTTITPRMSGDGFAPADGTLVHTASVAAGGTLTTKVQEGFLTADITESGPEYAAYRAASVQDAFTTHVTDYNRWWAQNVPYIDIPDKNIEKTLYYRWWLMRFNFLDANIAGNDYQFPTAVEGVLGYNNAIVLTSGMFIDDLKYLRDPSYAYGTWVSAGEVAKSGKYTDNPGDPANWSNSYTQYITEAAWKSYQLHGGPAPIAASLGTYGENDVKGLLKDFDANGNKLIEYNWGALTGNDADAVSFDWRKGASMDRTESAYLYSNALGAAQAYRAAGDEAKAGEMEQLAASVQKAVLDNLWNPESKLLEHRIAGGDKAFVPWKETNNYYPFSVGLMPKPDGTPENDQYLEALRLWADSDEYPIFPFFTANQKDKAEAAAQGDVGSNNFSIINSTVTFRFLSSVLRNYPNQYIDAETYKKLLYWNAWAQYQSGDNRYPDQNEFWANGSADPQKVGYRSWIHHTILGATNFTVIEDVAGLRTRDDAKLELSPIDIGWDHFTVNNLRYRDKDLSIVWDKPGDGQKYYGDDVPEGYSIYLDGALALTVDSLRHVVFDPATGDVQLPAGGAVTGKGAATAVQAMSQVRFDEDSRVVDIFAKAGKDITPADGDPVDLAQGATATATFSAPNRGPGNAVDGTTINEPFWGTAGSPNAQDSLEIDLGSPRTFDDIRVHFYRSSTTGTVAGYATPSLYQLEYQDGATWKAVPGQLRTPTVPRANLNEAAFAPVTAGRIRVTVQHAPGARTAIKEVVVSSTGQDVQAPGNQAPVVDAVASDPRPDGSLALTGTVQDDALPTGTLSSTWSVVSAPEGGSALFADPAAASTSVKFTAEGEYVLRLTATDGALTTSRDITVTGAVAGAAGVNVAPLATPTAEYTAGWNNVRAVNDGEVLNTGGQQNQLWGTWSGARPATRWLQYDWTSPVRVASTEVAFWHDSPGGTGDGVAVPASWKLQYRNAAGEWADVSNASGYGIADTGSNRTSFDPVTTTGLRAVFTANSNGTSNSAIAVSEWSVRTDVPVSTGAVHVPTTVGVVPTLPGTVEQVYSDGSRVQSAVTWPTITAEQVASPGTSFTVTGVVDGGGTATATVWVRVTDAVQINTLAPVTVTTAVGVAPSLPGTVTGVYNDGSQDSRLAVTWDAVPASAYAQAGTFEVSGAVAGTDKRATATVTVAGGGGQPVDTTKPVVSVSPSPAEPSGADGWWTAPVQVTVAAADDVDAAPKVEIDSGSGWVAYTEPVTVGEGTSTVQARATDAAGNVSDVASVSVKVDATVPTVSAAVDGRTVTLTGADTGSGVASVEYRWGAGEWAAYTGPVTAQGSEAATVSFRATDAAGNVSAVGTAEVAAVAVTATVALRSNGVLSAAGWYDQPVLVTVTTPAGTSGVSAQYRINTGSWNTYRSPFTVSTNGDNAVATRLIQDGAVVAGSESVTQVRVDNRAPVAIATRNPQSGTGSPRNPVEMTVTGTDAASGVDRTEYRVDGGEWAAVSAPVVFHQVGTFLVSSRAVDRAGNVSAVRSTTVVIRADVPTSVKATATRVAAGGFTTLVIAGFDRWDSLAVASGELALGPVSSDVNGAARKTVQIPAGTAKGAFPVTVTGTDGTTATVTLTITG